MSIFCSPTAGTLSMFCPTVETSHEASRVMWVTFSAHKSCPLPCSFLTPLHSHRGSLLSPCWEKGHVSSCQAHEWLRHFNPLFQGKVDMPRGTALEGPCNGQN